LRGPSDLLAWRAEFPAVERTTFLGTHTLGPASRRGRAAAEHFLDVWGSKASAETVWFEDIIPEMRRLESLYAHLIGADDDEIALTPSVTTGLASLASCLDFSGARNEIVISRNEFPTDQLVWQAAARRGGRVVWVEGREAPDFAAAMTNKTAVAEASRVSYLDGLMMDAHGFVEAAQAAGAFSIIDDFHGSGVVPLDVHDLGCDALVCGPYKYLLGTAGIAFVYVRHGLIASLEPSITGWFAQRDFFAFDGTRLDPPDTAQRLALGTPSGLSVFVAAAGLEIIHEVGVERIRQRSLELTQYTIERAATAGLTVRTPSQAARRGALVAIEVPDSKEVLSKLLAQRIIVDERHGALRVCPGFYSSEDDIDALFEGLFALGVGR
jgi:selenocysteine lyase/cysteine desulfurase